MDESTIPLLRKELDFEDVRWLGEYREGVEAVKLMDGTKTIQEIVEQTKIDSGTVSKLINEMIRRECLLVVNDRSAKPFIDRFGEDGFVVFNLIDGKRTIKEIIDESHFSNYKTMRIIEDNAGEIVLSLKKK